MRKGVYRRLVKQLIIKEKCLQFLSLLSCKDRQSREL